jgi:hypothetical protein
LFALAAAAPQRYSVIREEGRERFPGFKIIQELIALLPAVVRSLARPASSALLREWRRRRKDARLPPRLAAGRGRFGVSRLGMGWERAF